MKTNYTKLIGLAILSVASIAVTSCANQKEKSDVPSNSDRNISIRSVKYVNDDEIITINGQPLDNASDKLSASTKTTVSGSMDAMYSTAAPTFTIESAGDFDFTTAIQSNAVEHTGQSKASNGKLRAADVPLSNNKKYRLVFFQEGNNTAIYNGILSAGEDPELRVAANKKYSWYAFSINDANSVPNIDGSGTIASSDLANKDFMFASGEITTQEDENYLDITFLRQMSAIDVTINTRGVFGGITDNSTFSVGTGTGTSFTNIIQTGKFNIFNATFSEFEDSEPVKGSQMTVVNSNWGNAEKIGRFYTANTARTVAANNLRIRLNSLGITLDDNSTRNFAANTIVPIKHGAALNLTKGTLSKTNVRLIESGITVDGLVWARTNMIYDSNKLYGGSYRAGNSDAYRFRTNNEYARPNINTEYWNFGSTTPRGTDYRAIDACRRVYPEGTWRLPKQDGSPYEAKRLSDNSNRTKTRKSVSDGYRHSLIWSGSQAANSAYPDNSLIISAYGYRDGNTIYQIPSGSASGSGYLITRSNAYTSNNNNYVLYAQVNNGTIGNTSVDTQSDAAGVPIRCVRNINNN